MARFRLFQVVSGWFQLVSGHFLFYGWFQVISGWFYVVSAGFRLFLVLIMQYQHFSKGIRVSIDLDMLLLFFLVEY